MLQNFMQIKRYSAMEPETISKNGASSKSLMSRIISMVVFLLVFNGFAFAQSTIYFFFGRAITTNASVQIKFNGQETFLLKKKQKKVCNMRSEGKLKISFEKSFNAGTYNTHIDWADEIQLNLTKNSVHYIKLNEKKGGRVVVFEELTEDKGKKELAKKVYDNTFAYDEP